MAELRKQAALYWRWTTLWLERHLSASTCRETARRLWYASRPCALLLATGAFLVLFSSANLTYSAGNRCHDGICPETFKSLISPLRDQGSRLTQRRNAAHEQDKAFIDTGNVSLNTNNAEPWNTPYQSSNTFQSNGPLTTYSKGTLKKLETSGVRGDVHMTPEHYSNEVDDLAELKPNRSNLESTSTAATSLSSEDLLSRTTPIFLKPSYPSDDTQNYTRSMKAEEIDLYKPPEEENPSPFSYLLKYREYIQERRRRLYHSLSKTGRSSDETVRKILIVSTFRSGSSFMGDLISSHPLAFYLFEPMGAIARAESAKVRQQLTRDLFNCDFNSTGLVTNARDSLHFDIQLNGLVNNIVANMSDMRQKLWFAREACLLSRVRVLKTVRSPLEDFEPVLNETQVKIIFLARDPRATINSRDNLAWCIQRCKNITYFCTELQSNAETAQKWQLAYPDKIKIIRLEAFIDKITESTLDLFVFLNLPIEEQTIYFLLERTGQLGLIDQYIRRLHGRERLSVLSPRVLRMLASKESTSPISSHWRSKASLERAVETQSRCSAAMATLRYRPVENLPELRNRTMKLFSV